MTAKDIKRALIRNCQGRFACRYACDDVMDMDVMMLRSIGKQALMLEFEVKTSLSDLKYSEAQKRKWRYQNKLYHFEINGTWKHPETIPAYFYFVVPEDIADEAAEIIKEQYPKAGLYVYNGHLFRSRMRAKKLHNSVIDKSVYIALVNKMFSRYQKSFTSEQ